MYSSSAGGPIGMYIEKDNPEYARGWTKRPEHFLRVYFGELF